MPAPGVDFEQIGMQIDRRAGNDVKDGPGRDEQQEQDGDRMAVGGMPRRS
jgi:hypothetical protein